MAEFFKTSSIWIVDFLYEGRARRWFKAFRPDEDVRESVTATLHDLYGDRVRLVGVRRASEKEELQYVRGDVPKNVMCPTGRGPVR